MTQLVIDGREFSPELVVFDKDGTLIDFNFMWASWVVELARRMEIATGRTLRGELFMAIGYDAIRVRVVAGSPLAVHSMAELYVLTGRVAVGVGCTPEEAARAVNEAWFVPDPVTMARPLVDLQTLFSTLRERGVLTGIATSDDRNSTVKTIEGLGLAQWVSGIVTADDGLPNKPAPDMLLHLCSELGVSPQKSIMVGDSVADMMAGKNAGFGLRVGVLSGVSNADHFDGTADVILENVGRLVV